MGCSPSNDGIVEFDDDPDDGTGGDPGGAGGGRDAGVAGQGGSGGRTSMSCTSPPPSILKAKGQACGCNNECQSDHCVDGVCCSGPCDQTCHACNVPGQVGTCAPIPAGQPPVVAGDCPKEAVASCGGNGLCDGSGKCQKYADGTVCKAGKCEEGRVVGAQQCKRGQCAAGEDIVCAPYACNSQRGMCETECSGDAQCSMGRTCDTSKKPGSCGKKPLGAPCTGTEQCESGFCVDGVCCNTACGEMCKSCNLVGKAGECSEVPAGNEDPRKLCKDEGQASCKLAGVCDGKGGCAKYAAGSICKAATCSGGMLLPASVCDGNGSCVAGSALNCYPFACSGSACKSSCELNGDCQNPATCQNKSCGKKPNGIACQGGNECVSGFCVDGVCCNEACNGVCRFCASPSSPGRCVNVPNNVRDPRAAAGVTDPKLVCLDQGPSTCGNNGLCNGAGACQKYASGTVCKAESCNTQTNTYTAASTCNGNGTCSPGQGRSCNPYRCNGTSRCFTTCDSANQCLGANVCRNGSCGKLPNGAVCSSNEQCERGICAQGRCCAETCDKSCFSCAVAGSEGSCKPVPSGRPDPIGTCKDQGATSCGNDGTCDGAGGCRKYGSGTQCVAASCATGTFKARSLCDGKGTCTPGATRGCSPYTCNSAGTDCLASCLTNNDCAGTNRCLSGSCGLKDNGAMCDIAGECKSGQCVEGVCCESACSGLCQSCTVDGSVGKCVNVPAGKADPKSRCPNEGGCGRDGTCNGSGACRFIAAGTSCGEKACSTDLSKALEAPLCDGKGVCLPAKEVSCGTFICNAENKSCFNACTTAAQCKAGNACTVIGGIMTCGVKQNGDTCQNANECASGNCVNQICCGQAACPACQRCGAGGTCAAVADGMTDSACPADPAACGRTNVCVSGACSFKPAGTNCGTACSADGLQRVPNQCNGSGACAANPALASSCANNLVCRNGACLTECSSNADCTGGTYCLPMGSGAGMPMECRKKANGETCAGAPECGSGFCRDGVCCEQACTGSCKACNQLGQCITVTSAPDPDTCPNNGACGSQGCDAMGMCANAACNPVCTDDNLGVQMRTCGGAGTCVAMGSAVSCPGYRCVAGACLTTCQNNGDCASTHKCEAGACVMKGSEPPPDAGM